MTYNVILTLTLGPKIKNKIKIKIKIRKELKFIIFNSNKKIVSTMIAESIVITCLPYS